MKALIRIFALLVTTAFAGAADPHPSLPKIGSLDGLGVNIHFTEPQPGELEMIKAAGFKWVRMDLTWAATERTAGEYDFTAYDRLVRALEENGLRAVFILDYGNKLYDDGLPPHTDEGRAAFAKWAVAAVGHFAGKRFLWELWNEPNIAQFWKPKPDVQQYIALAKAVSAELRRAKLTPRECFIGPACSTIDLVFLEECCKAGLLEVFDGISVHPYRQKPPETVEEDYRAVRLLIHRYGPKDKAIPVLSGEWGYTTVWPSLGDKEKSREETQAKYLAQMFLTNIANDVPLSIWYDWRDDGDDPKEGEHHFGIVRRRYRENEKEVFEPKPAYTAMRVLSEELRGLRFNKTLKHSDDDPYPIRVFTDEMTVRTTRWPTLKGFDAARKPEWSARLLDGSVVRDNTPDNPQSNSGRTWLYDAPGFFTPEGEERRAAYRIMANWVCTPEQLIVRAPARVDWPMELSNLTGFPMDFDVGGSQQDLRRLLVCGTGGMQQPPLLTLAPGESFHARRPIVISTQNRGQTISGWVSFTMADGKALSFEQRAVVDLLNPIELELLSSNADHVIVRARKARGEDGSGRIAVTFESRQNDEYAPTAETNIEIPTDGSESIIALPMPQHLKDPKHSPFNVENWERTVLSFYDAKGTTNASAPFGGVAIHQPDLLTTDRLATGVDGDSNIQGDLAMGAAPAHEVCPSFVAPSCWIRYRFGKGWKFGSLAPKPGSSLVLPARVRVSGDARGPTGFTIWVKGDGKGCQARIRFRDKTGQVFQCDGPKIDFTDWRLADFHFFQERYSRLAHWGGANDGEIHYPIQWDSIFLLDNVPREPVEGEIYLSAPTLIY